MWFVIPDLEHLDKQFVITVKPTFQRTNNSVLTSGRLRRDNLRFAQRGLLRIRRTTELCRRSHNFVDCVFDVLFVVQYIIWQQMWFNATKCAIYWLPLVGLQQQNLVRVTSNVFCLVRRNGIRFQYQNCVCGVGVFNDLATTFVQNILQWDCLFKWRRLVNHVRPVVHIIEQNVWFLCAWQIIRHLDAVLVIQIIRVLGFAQQQIVHIPRDALGFAILVDLGKPYLFIVVYTIHKFWRFTDTVAFGHNFVLFVREHIYDLL